MTPKETQNALSSALVKIQILETQLRILQGKVTESRISIKEFGDEPDLMLPDDEYTTVSFGNFDVGFDPDREDCLQVRGSGRTCGLSNLFIRPCASNTISIALGPIGS